MNMILTPKCLAGSIAAIPSKSQAHRLLLLAALAEGETEIAISAMGQDIEATARCLRSLGANIEYCGGRCTVRPIEMPKDAVLDVGESGSTLRFLLPVVCALGAKCSFRLHGKLPQRPMEALVSELHRHGAEIWQDGNVISVSGKLTGEDFRLPGNISSQFLSGILLALPLLGGGSLTAEGPIESRGYLDLTVDALRKFGAEVTEENRKFTVSGTLRSPGALCVEGDWSNAAFWLVADRLGSNITVTGLDPSSRQADRAIVDLLDCREIDCAGVPDLAPALAVLAAFTPGQTRFTGAARLRLKESDRIAACTAMVRALGAKAEERPDGFTVWGSAALPGGTVDSFGDHRIAMAAAIAGTRAPVKILNAQAVEKSYPAFWSDYARLGGAVAWEDAI